MSLYTRSFDVLPGTANLSTPLEDEFELIEQAFNAVDSNRTIDLAGLSLALALKAPLDSPHFTGVPTVPTPAVSDNSTTVINSAFVQNVLGASGTLLPPQASHAGHFLKTDGTVASWDSVVGSIAWADVTAKPTTLAGFGITNAQPALELADGTAVRAFAPLRMTFVGMSVTKRGDNVVIANENSFPHYLLLAKGIL